MRMVNRTVVVLRPKQQFIDWVLREPAEGHPTVEQIRERTNAYLVPVVAAIGDQERFLKKHFKAMFEAELEAWAGDEEEFWPAKRDLVKFRDWFDVEFLEVVVDLAREQLEVEDDDA